MNTEKHNASTWNQVDIFIEHFGSLSKFARAIGHKNPTTVHGWRSKGFVPSIHHQAVHDALLENGLPVRLNDFIAVKELRDQVAA